MEVLCTIFSLPVTTYGLCTGLAMLSVLVVNGFWCMSHGQKYDAVVRVSLTVILLGWFFSRLVYAGSSYPLYMETSWIYTLYFWDGGYSLLGAYIGILLGVWMGAKWAKADCGTVMDGVAIGLPVGLIIMRLAEQGTGLGVGWYVEEGWPEVGLLVEAEYGTAHAIYQYEAIAGVILFFATILWCLNRKHNKGSGMLTFTMLYGAFQVFFESLRDDGHMEVHMGVHVQQVIAAFMLVVPVVIFLIQAFRRRELKKPVLIVLLAAVVAMITVAIVAEFGVDRWSSKVLAYGLMIGCLAGIAVIGLVSRTLANRRKS